MAASSAGLASENPSQSMGVSESSSPRQPREALEQRIRRGRQVGLRLAHLVEQERAVLLHVGELVLEPAPFLRVDAEALQLDERPRGDAGAALQARQVDARRQRVSVLDALDPARQLALSRDLAHDQHAARRVVAERFRQVQAVRSAGRRPQRGEVLEAGRGVVVGEELRVDAAFVRAVHTAQHHAHPQHGAFAGLVVDQVAVEPLDPLAGAALGQGLGQEPRALASGDLGQARQRRIEREEEQRELELGQVQRELAEGLAPGVPAELATLLLQLGVEELGRRGRDAEQHVLAATGARLDADLVDDLETPLLDGPARPARFGDAVHDLDRVVREPRELAPEHGQHVLGIAHAIEELRELRGPRERKPRLPDRRRARLAPLRAFPHVIPR